MSVPTSKRSLGLRAIRIAALAVLLLPALALALAVPPKPARGIADPDGVLSAPARAQLEAVLVDYAQGTTTRYGVAVFRSLGEQNFEDFVIHLAEAWKIGNKQKSDGALIVLFLEEHKIRIEVGYGLEDKLPDAICAKIIREQLAPKLRAGDVAGGLTAALAEIDRIVTGRAAAPITAPIAPVVDVAEAVAPCVQTTPREPEPAPSSDWSTLWLLLGLAVLVGGSIAAVSILGRRPGNIGAGASEGSLLDGADALPAALSFSSAQSACDSSSSSSSPSDSSSASSSSTSPSSDSSSDASGGSFGGGGASGDW